jgi:ATP-binding cassette subfamily B protein
MPRPEESLDDLPKAPINAESLRAALRLFSYLWPYKLQLGLGMLFLFFGSVVGLGFPWLAGDLVNSVLKPDEAEHSWLANANYVALGLLVILAVQASFAFVRVLLFVYMGEACLVDLRRDTFARMLRLPMEFHHSRRVGELTSRISADLTLIRDTLVSHLPHFLREVVMLCGGLVMILLTSTQLTLIMLLSVPVLMIIAVFFGEMIRQVAKAAQDKLAEGTVVVEESLQNIAGVKAYTNEGYEQQRYSQALQSYLRVAMRAGIYEGAFISFIVFALFGSLVFVLWWGARMVLAGDLTPGELTRFMLLTLYVAGAVGSFAEVYSQIQRALGASMRVREILETQPEPSEKSPAPLPLVGEVAFDKVSFRYPSRPETPVLRGLSLHAKSGERIALVGPSGAGKSTVVSLLLRFFDPESGQILIDGQDARSYPLGDLRSRMAIVPQDVLLFGGTIAENIVYGRPGASQEEIESAAKKANAHEFICSFPEAYNTKVGERGVQLSGGQRQRIAIARAILRDPAILILDEATSSLDAESEKAVMEALDRLMQGRTSLVIAHRLSTVRRADRIYVLREGEIAEAGTHAELMERPESIYRNLSLLQLETGEETLVGAVS